MTKNRRKLIQALRMRPGWILEHVHRQPTWWRIRPLTEDGSFFRVHGSTLAEGQRESFLQEHFNQGPGMDSTIYVLKDSK